MVYVSGPMTNKVHFNRGAFVNAQLIGEKRGHTMLIPGDDEVYSEEETATWTASPENRAKWLRRDVEDILCVDEVWVLPGWTQSRGSRFEVLIALELGIRVVTKWNGDVKLGSVSTLAMVPDA
jgi:hypothetical protein